PSGLPVAKVVTVDRRADSAFTRIYCEPVGRVQGVRHVMVLAPQGRTEHPEAANMQVQGDAEKADRAARARSKNEQAAAEKKAAEVKANKPEKPAKDPA
ncbi:MAG: rod shape-determining protein MreC, partial [Comamonas sp.]